jgi:hypothetical protein
MLRRRPDTKPAAVLARAQALLARPGISDWERGFLQDLVAKRGRIAKDRWKPLCKLAEIEERRRRS